MSMKTPVLQRVRDAYSMLSQRGNARLKENTLRKSLGASLLSNTYRGTYSSTAMVHYNDIYQPREKLTFKRNEYKKVIGLMRTFDEHYHVQLEIC